MTTDTHADSTSQVVFISYASPDKEVAFTVCAALEGVGIRCWIAPRDIDVGTSYAESILKGLCGARALLLVYSNHANASPHVLREVERAVSEHLSILPLRIQDIQPSGAMSYFLGAVQWMDAWPSINDQLPKLIAAVQRSLNSPTAAGGTCESSCATDSAATVVDSLSPTSGRRRWRVVLAILALVVATLVGIVQFRMRGGWGRTALSEPGKHSPPAKGSVIASFTDGLVSAPAIRELLEGRPEQALPGSTKLSLRLVAVRGGKGATTSLRDGDRLTSADTYFLEVETLTSGYLYLFQVDSRGQMVQLHPAVEGARFSTGANPVEAGARVRVPSAESGQNLRLDDNNGIEHLCCVLSARPWRALERALAEAEARGGPGLAVASPFGKLTRGVAEFAPAAQAENGDGETAGSLTYRGDEGFLAVVRWFHHDARR